MQSLVLAAILLTSYVAPNPPLSRHDVAIAGDAHQALVAWTQIDNSTARVHVSPLGSSKDIVMPLAGSLQIAPAIAFDGANFLVVWQEIDFPRTSTLAMRVSPTGVLLDPAPTHIGDYADAFLPRVVWASGQYRVTAGEMITSVNSAGVAAQIPTNVSADNAVDLALEAEQAIFARSIPRLCHIGFSQIVLCTAAQNLLTFKPGGDVALTTKPAWIEAAGDFVIWSDGTALNATRAALTKLIALGASNATIAGSLVVYEKDERLYAFDLDTNKETVLTDHGAIAPALLARGDGRFTLLYRTTSRPASLKTLDLGDESPARRRSF